MGATSIRRRHVAKELHKRSSHSPFTKIIQSLSITKKVATPIERLEREFQRQKTADRIDAMEKSLAAVLSQGGYSDEFRSEVLALAPGKKSDLIFAAAFTLLTESKYSSVHPGRAVLLDTVRLLQDLLPNASIDAIGNKLQPFFATAVISRGSEEKRLKSASLLAKMCNRLGRDQHEISWRLYCEVSTLRHDPDQRTVAAAEVFMQKTEQRRIIDIGHELKSVA